MDPKSLVVLLPMVLPLLGKLLLMVPVIPNKAIPLINTAVATAAKYWFLMGFGVLGAVPTPPGGETGMFNAPVLMAGFGALGKFGLSLAWGALDQAGAHFFYEFQRKVAAEAGKTSWLEKGKKSIF